MGEREPQPAKFVLRFESGAEVRCDSDTTSAFTFDEEPWGDHLWVYKSVDPEEEPIGTYYFRAQIENFESILEFMKEAEFTIIPAKTLSDVDRYAYELFLESQVDLKREKVAKELKQIMPPVVEEWVSPRQQKIFDNHLAFEVYLLMNDKYNNGEQL
jgi:hypothetical protein